MDSFTSECDLIRIAGSFVVVTSMFDTSIQTAVPISDYAIIVNPDDNVAVVKSETSEGLMVELPDGSRDEILRVLDDYAPLLAQ